MKSLGILCVLFSLYSHGLMIAAADQEPSAHSEGGMNLPKNINWLAEVDVSQVPKTPVRPVGSGTCPDAKCDGSDNDKCFESCGNKALPSDIYGCPKAQEWALSFDDGPSNFTGELLDSLDQLNIKATFCVLGSNVKKYPEMLKRAFDAGHHIASHTYSHPHLMSLTNEEIIYEMKATEEAIRDVIGIRPTYVRPPFGEADDRVKALMKAMGYKILLWNVDPTDYDVHSLPNAADKIQGAFKAAANGIDTGLNSHDEPGYISLQHDLYKSSIEQVPDVINFLSKKGYNFKTAAECIGDDTPHAPVLPEGRMKAQSMPSDQEKTLDTSSSKDEMISSTASQPPLENSKAEDNDQHKMVGSSTSSINANSASLTSPSSFYLKVFMFMIFCLLSLK
ncbi:unnamed protein product [Absidia cylindrospora]